MTTYELPRVDKFDNAALAARLREQAASAYATHESLWAQAEALRTQAGELMGLGDSLTEAANRLIAPVTEVFVDFSVIGQATEFTQRVRRDQSRQLRDGDHVLVSGDGVAAQPAVVVHVRDEEPEVRFRLLTAE